MRRGLTLGERKLAEGVFGQAVNLDRVRLHRGGFGGFAVTLGSQIFLPASYARGDFAAADLGSQALLVHELVHVWQFQTGLQQTLWSWAGVAASGGYGRGLPGYRYALPLPAFRMLNLEQQASVVEHGFVLRSGGGSARMPEGLQQTDLADAPFPIARKGAGPWA